LCEKSSVAQEPIDRPVRTKRLAIHRLFGKSHFLRFSRTRSRGLICVVLRPDRRKEDYGRIGEKSLCRLPSEKCPEIATKGVDGCQMGGLSWGKESMPVGHELERRGYSKSPCKKGNVLTFFSTWGGEAVKENRGKSNRVRVRGGRSAFLPKKKNRRAFSQIEG